MGKSICEKHQRAYEVEEGCDYCEPAKPSEATDAYADIVKSYYNPWASQVPSTTSAPEIEAAMNDAWAMLAAKEPAPALILPRGTMLPCTLSGLHCLGIPVVVDHSLREGEWRLEAGKIHAAKDVNDTLRATVTPPPDRSSFSIAEEVVREVAMESGCRMRLDPCLNEDAWKIWASTHEPGAGMLQAVSWVSAETIYARAPWALRAAVRLSAEKCVRILRKAAIPFHPEG